MKVKTFSDRKFDKVDNCVNSFIEENKVEVVDVKFSTATKFDGSFGLVIYSAMVIYKTKE